MKEIYFAFLQGLRKQIDFFDDQNPSPGNAKRSKFLGDIVDEFLPISDRSDGIIMDSAKDKQLSFCCEQGRRVEKWRQLNENEQN
jgi:hypothetical protein